ncbi:MAG TPA: FAD-dependent oxidoreductase, partial [Membranihabitans sp.]|nr:FAD-dependent oxidoreductase [Membranihabitans sp.]
MDIKKKQRLLILGAGFAGLKLARHLQKSEYDIYLIDKHNYHQFQPLLYQVATARLEPSNVSFPLRKVFQKASNVHIRLANVQSIDPVQKKVFLDHFTMEYDKLVIAMGCDTNYFGNENLEKYSMPMKSTQEALALRNRILLTFEHAFCTPKEEREGLMNFVVVGGGPTGVELSGALAEMKKYILPKDCPDMDFSKLNIHLVEGTGATLQNMSDHAQKYSEQYLRNLGVEVHLQKMVKSYDGRTLSFTDGSTLKTDNVVWAAGVTGVPVPGIPKESIVRGNRIRVNRFHEVA